MRCSIIRRVSTKDQAAADKTSLIDQLNDCMASIKQRGWTFVRDFNFADTHGQDLKSHPLYAEIKVHLANNECDIIMTHRIDRTLRDKYFWLDLCEILQTHRKLIASPFEIFDPANIDHELTLDIKSTFGHHERKRIRERVLRGMKSLKDRGKWTGGHAPFGYYFDPVEHKLKVDQNEAEIVAEIVSMILKNYSKVSIAEHLNSNGFKGKTDEAFTPRIVRRILNSNRLLFCSGRRFNSAGEIIAANWDPIISLENYQALLAKKHSRLPYGWSRKPAYLLTGMGIFKCGYCDHAVKTTNNRHKSKGGSYYYYCSGYYRTKNYCVKSKSVKMDVVNAIVLNDLKIRLKRWDVIEKGHRAYIEQLNSSHVLQDYSAKLDELSKRKKNLLNAIEFDAVSLDDVKNRLQEIETEHNAVLAKIAELNTSTETIDLDDLKLVAQYIDRVDDFSLDDQREIINSCIETIKLYNTDLYITYRFSIRENGKRDIRIQISNFSLTKRK